LNIRNEIVALDFDLACTLRLIRYDNERAETQAKLTAIEVGKLFGGGDDTNAANTNNVGRITENTQRW
jgi:hypothetical protein